MIDKETQQKIAQTLVDAQKMRESYYAARGHAVPGPSTTPAMTEEEAKKMLSPENFAMVEPVFARLKEIQNRGSK